MIDGLSQIEWQTRAR